MRRFASYPKVARSQVRQLLGGNKDVVAAAHREICEALGRPARVQRKLAPVSGDARQALGDLLARCLGTLSHTTLDAGLAHLFGRPSQARCSRVLSIASEPLRLYAALGLFLDHAAGLHQSAIDDGILSWRTLDQLVGDAVSPTAVPPSQTLAPMLRAWFDQSPTQRRAVLWACLHAAANRIHCYLDEQCDPGTRLPWPRLSIPAPGRYPPVRQVRARAATDAVRHRAERADWLADNLPVVLDWVDRSFAAIARIRDTFDAVCAHLRDGGGAAASRFSVTLQSCDPANGTHSVQTLDFQVYPGAELDARFGDARPGPDPLPAPFYLAFSGARDETGRPAIPLLEGYRAGLFTSLKTRPPAVERTVLQFGRDYGWSPAPEQMRMFLFETPRERRLAERAFAGRIVLLPIHALHRGFAMARAAIRTGLTTGARLGETVQQEHAAHCVGTADPASGIFFFHAIPKARHDPHRFYCDAALIEALGDIVKVMARNGTPIGTVAPTWRLRNKCGPGRYLYQVAKVALPYDAITSLIAAILLGRSALSHDLRHAFARFGLVQTGDMVGKCSETSRTG